MTSLGFARICTIALVALSLAGCASASAPPEVVDCDSAVGAVTPIERFDGMDFVTSQELAETIPHCSTVQEWRAALQAHPEVVSAETLSDEDATTYLAFACQLLPNNGGATSVCQEAVDLGLFVE